MDAHHDAGHDTDRADRDRRSPRGGSPSAIAAALSRPGGGLPHWGAPGRPAPVPVDVAGTLPGPGALPPT